MVLFQEKSQVNIDRYFLFNKEQKLIAEELVLSIGKKNSPEVIEAGTQKVILGC